jgi:hypothetical protein
MRRRHQWRIGFVRFVSICLRREKIGSVKARFVPILKRGVQGYALACATAYGCVAYGGGIKFELPSDPRPIPHRRGANNNTASC